VSASMYIRCPSASLEDEGFVGRLIEVSRSANCAAGHPQLA
jgi:hypothetical protein